MNTRVRRKGKFNGSWKTELAAKMTEANRNGRQLTREVWFVSGVFGLMLLTITHWIRLHNGRDRLVVVDDSADLRPPFNAEYLLYLLLRREERDVVIGDLLEAYVRVLARFNKRQADIWFYKQVLGSLWPLMKKAALRIGGLVWLGRILRRLIS